MIFLRPGYLQLAMVNSIRLPIIKMKKGVSKIAEWCWY